MKRVGMSFHETFKLNRMAIHSVLTVYAEANGKTVTQDMLRHATFLGNNYIKAMPRYALACGLLTPGNTLTEFGQKVLQKDPSMETDATLWLCHFHLSSPFGPGPAYWNHLVVESMHPGAYLDRSELSRRILSFSQLSNDREPAPRTRDSAASAFLNSYSDSGGLGKLGLFEQSQAGWRVSRPIDLPVWAFAYALHTYWNQLWPTQVTVNLKSFSEPGGLAAVLLLNEDRLNQFMVDLQREGVLDMYRIAPPFQVVRNWSDDDATTFLERAYESS